MEKIGCMGGTTITIRSWGFFLIRVFSTHPAGDQKAGIT